MNVLVVGATGRTGKHVLEQGKERGHRVTAFVRSPSKLDGANVEIVRGDPTNADALARALSGVDAVISCLGPPSLGRYTIVEDGARALVAAMDLAHVRRAVVVSAAVLFDGFLTTFARMTFLRNVARDSGAMERIVRAHDLDWTIVRPPRLVERAMTPYDVADDALPPGPSTVAFADVAHFMLDELEQRRHVRRVVGMAAKR